MKRVTIVGSILMILGFTNGYVWYQRGERLKNAAPEELEQCIYEAPYLQHEIADLETKQLCLIQRQAIPEALVILLLISEDRRFYDHHGVDLFRLLKILSDRSGLPGKQGGGSTLTQQLVKNLWGSPRRTVWAKGHEMIGAWILETRLEKDKILELYVNSIMWVPNEVGLRAGVRNLFGKGVEALTIHEMIMLVAGLPNPKSLDDFLKRDIQNRRLQNRIRRLTKGAVKIGILNNKTTGKRDE